MSRVLVEIQCLPSPAGTPDDPHANVERAIAEIQHSGLIYEVGALGATDAAIPLYAGRGWRPWRGRLSALTPGGVVRTPGEEGGVFVFPVSAPLDLDGELTCDWRGGDVW